MKYRDVILGRYWLGRLEKDEDLLESLTKFARSNQARLAIITGIGALQKARLAIYDQHKKQYIITDINEPAEVASLIGNVSMKDGEVFCHLHATLTCESGKVVGGHVCEGCSVFALEFMVQEMQGEALLRLLDEETGLALWNL